MSCSFWKADETHHECESCLKPFSFTNRRHHCRDCGGIFCHSCSTKSVVMFHRGFPKTKVRVCKYCVRYIEAKLLKENIDPNVSNATASPGTADRHGFLSETFVKSFQSKRKVIAPEDAVNTGHRLNRTLQKYEAIFLSGNDLFCRKKEEVEQGDQDDDNEDETPSTLKCTKIPSLDAVNLMTAASSHLTQNAIAASALNMFPLGTNADCMSVLFEVTAPHIVAPSFQRFKDGLLSAHHIAVNSEPQPLPLVIQPPLYY